MAKTILDGKLNLTAWYINTRRLASITGISGDPAAQVSITQNSRDRVRAFYQAEAIAQQLLLSGKIPILTKEYIDERGQDGRFVAGLWNLFSFRGMSAAVSADNKGKPTQTGEMHGDIPLGEDVFKATGKLFTEHVCSDSSVGYLSGRKRVYIVATFQFDLQNRLVEISPIIIGELVDHIDGSDFHAGRWPNRPRIYPQELDCFAKIEDTSPPTIGELSRLQNISEKETKVAFAAIIGEPFVPKDWPGEKSDLYTSRLIIAQKPMSAAFLLKGPAIFRPMHPADLGKRGDQIVRLFEEPSDVMILQHCNQVMPTVIRQMEAFAVNPAKPRFYCVIDGADTYRILKAYGYLAN